MLVPGTNQPFLFFTLWICSGRFWIEVYGNLFVCQVMYKMICLLIYVTF